MIDAIMKNSLSFVLREASEGRWITTKSGAHILIQDKGATSIKYPSMIKTAEDKAHYDEVLNSISDANINTFVTSQLMTYKDTHMLPETLYFQKIASDAIGVDTDNIGELEKYLPDFERGEFRKQVKTARKDLISDFNDNLGKQYNIKMEKYFIDKEGRLTIRLDDDAHAKNLENVLKNKIKQKIISNQKETKKEYGNEVILYRGITDAIPMKGGDKRMSALVKRIERTYNYNTDKADVNINNIKSIGKPLTSFTKDEAAAEYFSGANSDYNKGIVFQAKIPVKYIVASYKTERAFSGRDSVSGKYEKEFLVALPKKGNFKIRVRTYSRGED